MSVTDYPHDPDACDHHPCDECIEKHAMQAEYMRDAMKEDGIDPRG